MYFFEMHSAACRVARFLSALISLFPRYFDSSLTLPASILALSLFLGSTISSPVFADGTVSQSINLGEVQGKVFDELSNQPLEGVRAVLSKIGEEHKRYQTESKVDGTFIFFNIEPGDYTLTLSANEKLSQSKTIKLAAGESNMPTFKLEDLEGADVLRITGKRTLIHPENISSETNLDHAFIDQYRTGNDLRQLINSTQV